MSKKFDYTQEFKKIDFKKQPELYRIGRGEQGVLLVEPYKSELLPLWRFRTLPIAKQSAERLYQKFLEYKNQSDFVGMDMARKFIQMGYTRSKRYANHPSGKKYSSEKLSKESHKIKIPEGFSPQNQAHYLKSKMHAILPRSNDAETSEKARCAEFFYEYLQKIKQDRDYQSFKAEHKNKYE